MSSQMRRPSWRRVAERDEFESAAGIRRALGTGIVPIPHRGMAGGQTFCNAISGSIREARNDGIRHARAATTPNRRTTAA
jgi:hypothetical protein